MRALGPALLLLAGASITASEPAAEQIVAEYRDGTVTRGEYESWLRHHDIAAGAELLWPQVRRIALTESLAAAAEARGAHRDPALQRELTTLRNRVLNAALRQHVSARVEISDEEVEAYYQRNPKAFHRPRRVALSNLYKKLPPEPQAAAETRRVMEALHRELVEGADFAALARRESDSHTRYQGGYIGFVETGQMAPEIDEVAMRLAPGEISEILETDEGLTLLYCKSIAPARVPSPEEVRAKLRQNLHRLRFEQSWQILENELRKTTETELDDDALAAREAERLGLAASPEVASRLHWRRLEALAGTEMSWRVRPTLERPSEKDVRDLFEARKPHHPEQWRLAAIQLDAATGGDRRHQQNFAERLLARLSSGEQAFEDAAREHSVHASSEAGGNLGWLRRPGIAALGAGAFRAVSDLEPGELSRVLYFEPALWILRLDEQRERRPMSFPEARNMLAVKLTGLRSAELRKDIRREALRQLELRRPD